MADVYDEAANRNAGFTQVQRLSSSEARYERQYPTKRNRP